MAEELSSATERATDAEALMLELQARADRLEQERAEALAQVGQHAASWSATDGAAGVQAKGGEENQAKELQEAKVKSCNTFVYRRSSLVHGRVCCRREQRQQKQHARKQTSRRKRQR